VTPRWTDLLTLARTAEQAGFDSIWTFDELVWRFEEVEPVTFWECWSLLSAVAAVTSRAAIGTLVTCANYRNPALLAKMAETVDEITGGRLILGLGAGWSEDEFRTFGFEFDHHVGRFEEALRIVHGLLRDGRIDFEGQYYQARDCELAPRGPRPGGIPILVGGLGPRMMRLAARYADGWNAWIPNKSRPGEIPPLRERLDAACREVGRDPTSLERSAGIGVAFGGSRLTVGPLDWTPGTIKGSPEEIAAVLRSFAAEGLGHAQLAIAPGTPAGIEAFVPVLEALDRGA
jgi:alkanesulfonate monooxygenase SsuD/methylene tetrahydromethanopterin reductase-like flavin-dependent oxidoreductase (luciferase family)